MIPTEPSANKSLKFLGLEKCPCCDDVLLMYVLLGPDSKLPRVLLVGSKPFGRLVLNKLRLGNVISQAEFDFCFREINQSDLSECLIDRDIQNLIVRTHGNNPELRAEIQMVFQMKLAGAN